MSIVMTTPTGNIGHVIVEKLIAAGAPVTAFARKPENLSEVVRAQVEVAQGDQTDAEALVRATVGAEALFWLCPNNMTAPVMRDYYQSLAQSAVRAITENKIPYVVNLSSMGAQHDDFGLISLIGEVEQVLNTTGANVLHLRPAYFFENFLNAVETIQMQGLVQEFLPADRRLPMIATPDIAAVAAQALLARDFTGKTARELHGPADLTPAEATALIGAGIGKELQYQGLPVELIREIFPGLGASADFVEGYIALNRALGEAPVVAAEARTPENTTPTPIQTWAEQVVRPRIGG